MRTTQGFLYFVVCYNSHMNKKFIIISIVVIVLLFVFIFNTKEKSNTTIQEIQNPEVLMDNMSQQTALEIPVGSSSYAVVPNQSTLNWTAKKTIVADWIDKGTINISSGRLSFNGDEITEGEIIVDMNTINSLTTGSGGSQDRLTNHLKSADFFDVAKYPTSKIVITSVSQNQITGNMTIKDVTKPVSFPVSIVNSNSGRTVSGKISINRADFGVKYGSTSFFKDLADRAIIDDVFTIDFSLTLR